LVRDGGTTNDPTPTLAGGFSGPLAPGEELQILRDATVVGTPTQTSSTSWSFTDNLPGNGDYDYTVRVVDAAGNVGRASPGLRHPARTCVAATEAAVTTTMTTIGAPRGELSVEAGATIGALALGDLLDSGATAYPPAASETLAGAAAILSAPAGSDPLGTAPRFLNVMAACSALVLSSLGQLSWSALVLKPVLLRFFRRSRSQSVEHPGCRCSSPRADCPAAFRRRRILPGCIAPSRVLVFVSSTTLMSK
jgi:hypothetical protein